MTLEGLNEWIAALRSNKYEQGQQYLHNDGKYCCLGVLCDISGVGEWVEVDNSFYSFITDAAVEASEMLPDDLIDYPKWALDADTQTELTKLNDGWQESEDGAFNKVEPDQNYKKVIEYLDTVVRKQIEVEVMV